MSTKVEAPPPRNLAQETSDTLQTQIALAPDQLAAYQQTAPGYAATDIGILGRSLFGEDFTGNLSDINRRLTSEAATQSQQSTTAQREADLADVQALGGTVQKLQRDANSELFGNLTGLDEAAAAGMTPGAAGTDFLAAARRSSGGYMPGADTPTALESMLESAARNELGLGDQLSADEARQVRVQSRAAADARGRGFSNAALADEVLNTSAARNQRLNDRRAFALTTNSALRAGQAADRGFGLQTAAFNASRADADRSALGQAAGFEQGLADTGFQRRLAATQARLATFTDPFQGVLGRSSSNFGTNQQLFGNAAGTAGASASATRGMFDPFNAYASDLYNTNYNAQAAANIATGNNRAGVLGGLFGGLGALGGGLLGG